MNKINSQKGSILTISVLIFAISSTLLGLGVAVSVVKNIQNLRGGLYSKQAFHTADALQEDVLYRMKKNILVSTSEILSLGGATATVAVIGLPYGKKITTTSNSSDYVRKLQSTVSQTTGVSFAYAIQSGNGGFEMEQNATVDGNVYSNGTIVGETGATITGGAISASTSASGSLIKDVKVGADAWAHNVINTIFLSATGTNYCQIGTGNSQNCNTSKPDPSVQSFPISDATIDMWKADALVGGTTSSLTTSGAGNLLGAKKIIGNLEVGGTLSLEGVLWVTGDLTVKGGSVLSLSPSYSGNSGIIIVEGVTNIENNSTISGSGQAGTYIMILSTSDCDSLNYCGKHAINVSNNAGAVILNAQKGSVYFANNSGTKAVTANRIYLKNNAHIDYVVGLIDTTFSTGPMGSWNIDTWQETI